MEESQVKTEETNGVFPEELRHLLQARSDTNFELVKLNYKIGRAVFPILQQYGENAVSEIAASYGDEDVAFRRYLFDACRVFTSLENAGQLYKLRKGVPDAIFSWGFLVATANNKNVPTGDSDEARMYWENEISRMENNIGRLGKIAENLGDLPNDILPQVEGLMVALQQSRPREAELTPIETPVGTILHVCDEHFGDNELLPDVKKSGEHIVARARVLKPDLIVSSGDILDERQVHDSPALFAAMAFVKALAEVAPVFLLKGTTTHDGVRVKFFESLETRHKVYVAETLGMIGYRVGEFFPLAEYEKGLDALIFAIPPATKGKLMANGCVTTKEASLSVTEMLRSVFEKWGVQSAMARADGVPVIVSGHGTVVGSITSTGQKMLGRDIEVSLEDLALIGADVVCFGHIHKAQHVGGNVFYSGSIAKLTVGETEDKGFYTHRLTPEARVSEFIVVPTRDIVSREFEGMPDLGLLPEFKQGSLVRICYRVVEEDVHKVDEDSIRAALLERGAGEVRIERSVIPKQIARAAGISRISALPDKFVKWCSTTGTEVTEGLLEKVALLTTSKDVLFAEVGVAIPQKRRGR